jgi:hypothetical protein
MVIIEITESSIRMRPIYIIGDIHGQYKKMVTNLQQAKLIDDQLDWIGGDATLIFLGDFFDRGPAGLQALQLAMFLQERAELAGGEVTALLGNHEVLILSAYHFGHQMPPGEKRTFMHLWQMNGGLMRDLIGLEPEHVVWISRLPAMILLAEHLLMHADALFYVEYGHDLDTINQAFVDLLRNDDMVAWNRLLRQFAERNTFLEKDKSAVVPLLQRIGGQRVIHGHTPISFVTEMEPVNVVRPLDYADGLCTNVDGGMYLGGPGFIYRLPDRVDAGSASGSE